MLNSSIVELESIKLSRSGGNASMALFFSYFSFGVQTKQTRYKLQVNKI